MATRTTSLWPVGVIVPAALALTLAGAFAQESETLPEADPTLREPLEARDPTLPRELRRSEFDAPEDEARGQNRSRTIPNFGKPVRQPDPRLTYPGRPKQARKPLPRTEAYRSAPRAVQREYVPPIAPQPPPPYAVPAQIPVKLRPKLEEAPFAPLGIGVGSLRLYPFVEVGAGYDSNVNRASTNPQASAFTRVDAGVRAQSDWSRHEFTGNVQGAYTRFNSAPDANRPEGTAKFNLRLDYDRDTKFDFELRGALTTQRPGSPEFNVFATNRPAVFTYGATGGVTRNFGRFEGSIALLTDRTNYDDGKLSNGGSVNLSRNDYSSYGVRGRVGYEITPGIKPFVEATADTRTRDITIDGAGFNRNSTGYRIRAGSTFELSRTLTGEISAGMIGRSYADPNLRSLKGAAFDAALIWTASPLTTVTLRATTTANETTIPNASGYVTRLAAVEVNHALLRNLTLGGIAQWSRDTYQGIALSQDVYSATLKAEYSLTRSVVVKGSFTHERLKSSVPGADYTANVYLLGLRLQR